MAMITWTSASETVAGLVLAGRVSRNSVRPELFQPPYNLLISGIKKGKEPEEIMRDVGVDTYQTALYAEKSLNGAGDAADWVTILERSQAEYATGLELERLAKRLVQGDTIEYQQLLSTIQNLRDGKTYRTPLSKVVAQEMPFMNTGWKLFDSHVGGIPEIGLINIAGNPGSGKTTLILKLSMEFAKEHKDKIVAFYSIEMMKEEVKGRLDVMFKNTPESILDRIHIVDRPLTYSQIIADAAQVDNLGIICIDFADLVVRGESSESKFAELYRDLALAAKELGVPIILVSQLSRAYDGGIPRPYHIRYTGMAEALSWMILMTYNPSIDYFAEKDADKLPIDQDLGFVCVWKVRGGFRQHKNDSPGALGVRFHGKEGWTDDGEWYSLRKF